MFIALAGSELSLGTGTTTAPSPPVPSDDLFLSPTFVQTLVAELAADAMFGPIVRGAAAALGKLVDRLGSPIVGATHALKGETFLVRCGLLYRRRRRPRLAEARRGAESGLAPSASGQKERLGPDPNLVQCACGVSTAAPPCAVCSNGTDDCLVFRDGLLLQRRRCCDSIFLQ